MLKAPRERGGFQIGARRASLPLTASIPSCLPESGLDAREDPSRFEIEGPWQMSAWTAGKKYQPSDSCCSLLLSYGVGAAGFLFAKSPALTIVIFFGSMCRRIASRICTGVSAAILRSMSASRAKVRLKKP